MLQGKHHTNFSTQKLEQAPVVSKPPRPIIELILRELRCVAGRMSNVSRAADGCATKPEWETQPDEGTSDCRATKRLHSADRHSSADGHFAVHAYPCHLHTHCRPLTPHTSCSGHRAACRSFASVGVVGWSSHPCPWSKSSRPLFLSCTLVTTCSTCSLPPAVRSLPPGQIVPLPSRPPGRDFRCCQLGLNPFVPFSFAFNRESP
jgi:hypothetical protein